MLERLHEAATQMYVAPTSFAWTYLGLRDIDNAFVWMDRAVDTCDELIMQVCRGD